MACALVFEYLRDDTSLFSTVFDPQSSAEDINHDLNLIKKWAFQWKMTFNPDPTKQAAQSVFSKKRVSQNQPLIFSQDTPVTIVDEHKHLGLLMDKKMNFSSHIREIIAKANKGVGMIKYLSRYLPRHSLDQIYELHVRPHFDYCDVIYHIPNFDDTFHVSTSVHYLMSRLESVQYAAALAITDAWRGTSRDKIYHELGWEPLADRRWYRSLTLFYKIINNLTPSYLKAIIPDARFHRYALRHGDCIPTMRYRTDTFKNSSFSFLHK